jgi:hypothetical protein
MMFLTLLKKELRESVPYILAAVLLFSIVSFLMINGYIRHQFDADGSFYWRLDPGQAINLYRIAHSFPVGEVLGWLIACSLGLGLALGIVHFWLPGLTRTWPFLVHRSVTRTAIFKAKLICALLAVPGLLGITWTIIYAYASQKHLFVPVPYTRHLIEGWILIWLGFITYLGTSLSALSSARWYTTRLFGLFFSLLAIFPIGIQHNLGAAFAWIGFIVLILGSQILVEFREKQF